jgi:RuvB-like protein 2
LDRLLIISTTPYTESEISTILSIRCEEEDVEISEDAMEALTQIGVETSLRYSIHLIATANLIARKRKSTSVQVQDISKAYTLFLDQKRSVQCIFLLTIDVTEFQDQYMFHHVNAKAMQVDVQ